MASKLASVYILVSFFIINNVAINLAEGSHMRLQYWRAARWQCLVVSHS